MCSAVGDCLFTAGFPHSDIAGLAPAHGSPTLFAVYHVLLRLLTPRHPPFAFSSFFVMRSPQSFIGNWHNQLLGSLRVKLPYCFLSMRTSLAILLLRYLTADFSAADDPGRAIVRLSSAKPPSNQFSWLPMGLSRLELLTFPLSEGCSNRLSYRPILNSWSAFQPSALSFFIG
jgi:hypothetical protein